MLLTLVSVEGGTLLTLVVSGRQNGPYIGVSWRWYASWRSAEGGMLYVGIPYIVGLCSALLHLWSVGRLPCTLVVFEKKAGS